MNVFQIQTIAILMLHVQTQKVPSIAPAKEVILEMESTVQVRETLQIRYKDALIVCISIYNEIIYSDLIIMSL